MMLKCMYPKHGKIASAGYWKKSKFQVTYMPKHQDAPFQYRLEWPQVLAVSIPVDQSTRGKKLLEFLQDFSLSVDYSWILRLETQLANAIIDSMIEKGTYLPTTVCKGAFIIFAVDNNGFNEDTSDRKYIIHGTVIALYQRQEYVLILT